MHSNALLASCFKVHPNVQEVFPPGGANMRDDGRSVITLPLFILDPLAYELPEILLLRACCPTPLVSSLPSWVCALGQSEAIVSFP